MLPTLYGKKSLQTTLSRMASGERLAQSFLFYGDAGLGRKTVAHWFSALLLCEHPENGQPCGHCKSCHNLQKDCHPDLILVPHSGKLGGFSVETVRQICSSVSIPPNNGNRKVYLFLDCDQMDDRAQNLLLKQLEERRTQKLLILQIKCLMKSLLSMLTVRVATQESLRSV